VLRRSVVREIEKMVRGRTGSSRQWKARVRVLKSRRCLLRRRFAKTFTTIYDSMIRLPLEMPHWFARVKVL